MRRRARRAALAAAALAVVAACGRPPKGMTRLDSGSSNHWFKIDHQRRHLLYMAGGGDLATKLGVVDLDSGHRKTYGFPHEKIVGVLPAGDSSSVKVAVEGTGVDNEGEYSYLRVDAETGGIRAQAKRDKLDGHDLALFGEPQRPDTTLPNATRAFAGPASSATADDDGLVTFWYKTEAAPRPGVRTAVLRRRARVSRFFPTATEPASMASASEGTLYATYAADDGTWRIEELSSISGARRPIAVFPTKVESMASVGLGLAVLRQADDGSARRRLAMVDATTARVALELPWNDGESEILAADPAKRLLYIRMNEGGNETAWAVHFDEAALRAASDFLARHRGSGVRKLTDTDVLGLAMTGGMLFLVVMLVAMRES